MMMLRSMYRVTRDDRIQKINWGLCRSCIGSRQNKGVYAEMNHLINSTGHIMWLRGSESGYGNKHLRPYEKI